MRRAGALAAGEAAGKGLDNIMRLPTETQHDDSLIHRDVLHGHYLFENAQFRYNDDQRIPLRLVRLEDHAGEADCDTGA